MNFKENEVFQLHSYLFCAASELLTAPKSSLYTLCRCCLLCFRRVAV
nr:MAG TPA: hypothetical protein [Caudoviricetes sp.]